MDAACYISQARTRKAERLAFVAWAVPSGPITAAMLESASDMDWDVLATAAGVRTPVGPVTRLMTKDRLYSLEMKGAVAA